MSKRKQKQDIPPAAEGGYIEFAVDDLRAAIETVKAVRSRKSTFRRDMESYHIEATREKKVFVSAMGPEMQMQVRVEPLAVQGWGVVMPNADALITLLGAYHEPRVRVLLDGDGECVLKGTSTRLNIPAYDPAKELKKPVPGALTRSGWVFSGRDLAEAIRVTKGFVDNESTRYAFGGLCLEFPEADEGPCEVVTTDGRRMSIYRVPVRAINHPPRRMEPGTERHPMKGVVLLRSQAALIAYRLARRAGDGPVAIGLIQGDPIDLERSQFKPGLVQVVTKEVVLTTTLQDGYFTNWRNIQESWQGEVKCIIRIDRADRLARVLALATATANSEAKMVNFTASGGSIMLDIESNTKGKAQLFLSNIETVGQATFEIEALMLRQMLEVLIGDPVEIRIRTRKDPVEIISGTWWGICMGKKENDYKPAGPHGANPQPQITEAVAEAIEAAEELPDHEGEDEPDGDDDGSIPIEDTMGTPPAPAPVIAEPSANGPPAKPKKKRK